jgi:transposase
MPRTINRLEAVATIGIDIGKNTFHLVGLDRNGAIVLRQKLSRRQVEARLANMPPCLIGMEACVGAHHLSRQLKAYGHDARLMPARYVRPYSKGQKNDFRDAEAIAEAVLRPTMKFVAIKTVEQLDLQALHRVRERLVCQRTSVSRQCRDLLEDLDDLPMPIGHFWSLPCQPVERVTVAMVAPLGPLILAMSAMRLDERAPAQETRLRSSH